MSNCQHNLSLCVLVAALAGCSDSGLKLAEVSGVVTVDGQPMDYVGVVFHPSIGPIATGNTDAEGRFKLTTANESGALVGQHTVTIADRTGAVTYTKSQDGLLGAPVKKRGGPAGPRFSKHYARSSTSDLQVSVEAGERNEFVFELDK